MSRTFERLKLLLKKFLFAAKHDEEERGRWRERVTTVGPHRLVFVDERDTHTSMACF